jgi:hypothetical protein
MNMFGKCGIRVIAGLNDSLHNGWGGLIPYPSGKMVHIYREGSHHGIRNGSKVVARDSYNDGKSWSNYRVLYHNALHDARPDPPRMFAGTKSGFMVNRASEGGGHTSPAIITSTDEFVTWSASVVPTISPYTFASNSGFIDFPASVGGDDTNGFMAFGYLSAGGMDALCTTDNVATFSQAHEVALPSSPATGLSEWSGARLGSTDRWMFYLRNKDAGGWRSEAACYVTSDPLNWGAMRPSGLTLKGNPPHCFYDGATNEFTLFAFSRAGRFIDGFGSALLKATADADDLWNANGDFSALGIDWEMVIPVPNWATGYLAMSERGASRFATFTCAEPGFAGGASSAIVMIGDFETTDFERAQWQSLFNRNAMMGAVSVGFTGDNAPTGEALISAPVRGANLPAIETISGGSAARIHHRIRNSNGNVGGSGSAGSSAYFEE